MNFYSQNGEDRIYVPLLPDKGRLLEIGAFDPVALSNSRALIEAGWEAVLVEANPACVKKLLEFYRVEEPNERVIIVNALLSLEQDARIMPFKLCWDAVSTTEESHYRLWKDTVRYFDSHMASTPLRTLLRGLPGPYDFISIDVEGTSGAIACAIFGFLRPTVLCVEHTPDDREMIRDVVEGFYQYKLIAENAENYIFQRTVGRAAEVPAFQAG